MWYFFILVLVKVYFWFFIFVLFFCFFLIFGGFGIMFVKEFKCLLLFFVFGRGLNKEFNMFIFFRLLLFIFFNLEDFLILFSDCVIVEWLRLSFEKVIYCLREDLKLLFVLFWRFFWFFREDLEMDFDDLIFFWLSGIVDKWKVDSLLLVIMLKVCLFVWML